jgi:hypothetical protein
MDDYMRRACTGKKRNAYSVSIWKPKGKDYMEDPTLIG